MVWVLRGADADGCYAPSSSLPRSPLRQLLPEPTGHVDPRAVYALAKRDEVHVRVNMVTTLDGAAAFRGRVGPVSGPPDDALLHLLRGFADVVLVGAGTIRAEGYGPDLLPAAEQRRRVARAYPSAGAGGGERKLALDLAAPVFEASVIRPLVLTTSDAPAKRRAAASKVADVVYGSPPVICCRRLRRFAQRACLKRMGSCSSATPEGCSTVVPPLNVAFHTFRSI